MIAGYPFAFFVSVISVTPFAFHNTGIHQGQEPVKIFLPVSCQEISRVATHFFNP